MPLGRGVGCRVAVGVGEVEVDLCFRSGEWGSRGLELEIGLEKIPQKRRD